MASSCTSVSSSGCPAGSTCLPGLCLRWGRCCLQEAGPCGRLTQQAAGSRRRPAMCRPSCCTRLLLGRHPADGAVHAARQPQSVLHMLARKWSTQEPTWWQSCHTVAAASAGSTSVHPTEITKDMQCPLMRELCGDSPVQYHIQPAMKQASRASSLALQSAPPACPYNRPCLSQTALPS